MGGFDDEIGAVVLRAKRQFPDHRLDVAYGVCLPVYEVTLKATEMAEGDLTTTARFVLQIVQIGVVAADEVGRLMGLDDGEVTRAAGELLAANLIMQREDQNISITEEGRRVLREGGRMLRPRNRHLKVAYDAATRLVLNMDIDRLLHREAVRKRGLFVPAVGPRKPRVSGIPLEDVVEYDRVFGSRRRKASGEILEISAIRDIRLKYRDDVIVAKLDSAPPAKPLFAAYRAGQYLVEESAALERFAERGIDLVPEEHQQSGVRMPWAHSTVVRGEESDLLESIESLDERLLSTEQEAATVEAERSGTLDAGERERLADRVKALEEERAALRGKLADVEKELERRTSGATRLIRTEGHRRVLLEAIDRANEEVTLVSAWLGEQAFDGEVQDKLVAAMKRGARVRIAWGLGTTQRRGEGSRNRERGESLLKGLSRRVPKEVRELLVVKRVETHEKFIICDDAFCAWGSFNWLSYRGERDSGYRRETSYYSEREEDLQMWKSNAASLFKVLVSGAEA